MGQWRTYDHYGFAFVAIAGTALALVWALWLMTRSRWAPRIATLAGVVPPFINVLGLLFGLTLAFLANDTWSVHDRAMSAIQREAGALHSLKVLAAQLPEPHATQVRDRVDDYARSAAIEWPLLARREASNIVTQRADYLLAEVARPDVANLASPALYALMLGLARDAREERDKRIALSQAHVNPLKWLCMALLGFMTLLSIAVAHVGHPRAAAAALLLFAASAGPMAAIVLVQANPFQQPTWVSPAPFLAVAGEPSN